MVDRTPGDRAAGPLTLRATALDVEVATVAFPLPAGRRWATRLVGLITIVIGVDGLLTAHVSNYAALVVIGSLTTVPVAIYWWRAPWPSRRRANLLVVYADVGIAFVLFSVPSSYVAMPGSALLAVVAMFTIAATSVRVLVIHLVVAVALLAALAISSFAQGTGILLVLARTITLLIAFAAPYILGSYLSQLRRRAYEGTRDQLTGLLNSRGLSDATELLNEPVDRVGEVVGVMVIDIDQLKEINDRLGHVAGDSVIAQAAARVKSASGGQAVVARIGGDEFVSICVGSRADVLDVQALVRTGLQESYDGPRFRASTGSALGESGKYENFAALIRRLMVRADVEMYRMKAQARGQDMWATQASAFPETLDVRERIRSLIDVGGPTIVFQPICATDTAAVVGYEALSRFPNGHGSPQTWFRDAATAGVVRSLEESCIENTWRAMTALPAHGFVSINASVETIRGSDLAARLRPHIGARQLCIELTEFERVDDYPAILHALEAVRDAGVLLSIDDVGAGYAGLRHIVELRPDIIKIDRALIADIDQNAARHAAAAALVSLAGDVGAEVVAEGVETEAELQAVRELGVTMVQGYLVGRPAPADQFDGRSGLA